MDSLGNITGLASIVGNSAISPSKGVSALQNNANLLSSLSDNTVLRGVVQSKGANNTITLKTEQGTLILQTDVFLKRGAEVAVRIEQRAHEALIRIVSVNGQSLNNYLEATTLPTAQDEVAHSSSLVSSPASSHDTTPSVKGAPTAITEEVTPSTVLRGVFLSTPDIPTDTLLRLPVALQMPLTQASPGTSLQIEVLAIAIPDATGEGYISLAPNAASTPLPTSFSAAPTPGYGLTPAQRLSAEPYLQSVSQNLEAAQSPLPELSRLSPVSTTNTTALSSTTALPVAAENELLNMAVTPAPFVPASQPNLLIATFSEQGAPILPTLLPTQPATPQVAAQSAIVVPTEPSPLALPQHVLTPSVQPEVLTGTVIQNSIPRELTLQTPLGTIKLFVTTPLPKGSVIQFELQQVTQVRQVSTSTASASQDQNDSQLPEHFSALAEIADLRYIGSGLSTPFPVHLIPRPGPALASELLFFLSALKGGNLSSWLGEAHTNELALGSSTTRNTLKGNVLARLEAEFSSLKPLPDPLNDGAWRSVLLPIFDNGQIQPIEYFIKKQKYNDEKGREKQTDHFMVDLELTRLGRLQLDGLVQKNTSRLQFDLIIRTPQPWDEEIRYTIRDIYRRAQEISGFGGSLTFRHGAEALISLPVIASDTRHPSLESILV